MTITPISCGMKEEYIDLTNLRKKDSPLAEDLETFVNYFIKNRLKVTLKNRWILFKHIKSIEKGFINKDSFISFGKEEKRGEEVIKKFWITPKGKKLINKMIDYYIKTGRM
jgi:hypothetical protein